MSNIKILKLESIDSTNSYAMQNLSDLNDKQVITADYQSAGKGRQGRKWVSDNSSNAYVSIVLKPNISEYPYSNVTQYLSVVLCEVLEENYKLKPKIKWPNDILIDGFKISGILCEAKTKNNKIEALVLGFGVNLNMEKETLEKIDQKATSLKVLTNNHIDTDYFINTVLELFFAEYDQFVKLGFKYIKDDYVERCDFIGKQIKIKSIDGVKEYFAEGIDGDGTLVTTNKEGNKTKILTGDLIN